MPCFQDFPCQSVRETPAGGGARPSHHTPPSLVSPTLVKTVFLAMVDMAWGLVLFEVPGATPKKPFSGLMALSLPEAMWGGGGGGGGGAMSRKYNRQIKCWLQCWDQINTLEMQHGSGRLLTYDLLLDLYKIQNGSLVIFDAIDFAVVQENGSAH